MRRSVCAAVVAGVLLGPVVVAHGSSLDVDGGVIQVFTFTDVDAYAVGMDEPRRASSTTPAQPGPGSITPVPTTDEPPSTAETSTEPDPPTADGGSDGGDETASDPAGEAP